MSKKIAAILLALSLLALFTVSPALAQSSMTIDIFGPGQTKTNIMLTQPLPAVQGASLPPMAADMQAQICENLRYLPFLRQVGAGEIIGGDRVESPKAPGLDFKRFQLSRVDLLITSAWTPGADGKATVAFRVYETFTGGMIFGQEYADIKPAHMPEIADSFCSRLMEALTGRVGFFQSRLAFVRKDESGKEIWVAGPTGHNARKVTSLGGVNTSPAWSLDGKRLLFTHVAKTQHLLGMADMETGKVQTVDLPGSTVISPMFMPDGRLAVTLDIDGQPNIYQLGRDWKPTNPLAKSWSIDVSPSFDRAGRKMAFVSGRLGNPHIFLLDMASKQVRRVTYDGKYNTNPSLSPDGRLVAFSRDTADGHRIFVHDLETGIERQVTFGPGFDEEPTFGPEGYFIAFSSSRSGVYKLYLTTRHGDEPVMLQTGPGEARAPSWTRGRE